LLNTDGADDEADAYGWHVVSAIIDQLQRANVPLSALLA
jgi:hypothetical protein